MDGWNFYDLKGTVPAVSAPPPPPASELSFSSHESVSPVTVSAVPIAEPRLLAASVAAAPTSAVAPAPALAPSPVNMMGQPLLEGLDEFYVWRLQRLYARMHPYQRELFRISALQDSIVYLQTGGGKTWVAAALTCYRLAVHRGTRVFFVVRGVALAEQQAAVLRQLVDTPVACIVGGVKQFKTPQLFLLATEYRVAVFIDTILFKWLGDCPELIDEGLVSMVMLDEVHHAQAGPYKLICELLHSRREKTAGEGWDAGLGQRGSGGGSSAGANARARLEGVGRRSPASAVLASELRRAVEKEKDVHDVWALQEALSAGATTAASNAATGAAAAGSGATDGIGVRVASQVLEVMLRCAPRDVRLPHFGGLSASPVVHFSETEQELVELLAITRCRLVSVVDEAANLHQHLPQPALLALSFLPVFDDRVLQAQLRHVMLTVFRRVEALIGDSVARNKLNVLSATSVLSPGFCELCKMFSVNTVLRVSFREKLRIPRNSELVAKVENFQANQVLEAGQHQRQMEGSSDSTRSTAATQPSDAGDRRLFPAFTDPGSATWRYVSELRPEEEADMCIDFIQQALTLLQCLSDMLIALEAESRKAMMKKFLEVYSIEAVKRMGTSSLAITAVVLRPILKKLYYLIYAMKQHAQQSRTQQDGGGEAKADGEGEEHEGVMTTETHASLLVAPSPGHPAHPPPLLAPPQTISDAINVVPPAVRHLSTRTQVFLRLFAELALVAVNMSNREASSGGTGGGGGGGGGERGVGHLRVLAFVGTRDQATYFMNILRRRSPWVWQVLQPSVLLGQGSGKKNSQNYMTRPQQVEVLDRFRAGHTRLVFATSVAEEGIDVPACHVVVRCNPQTELRTIVQCCGRLRMRRTLFVSLSNLLNGHPRLGFLMRAVQNCEGMLVELGRRSCRDEWNLARDDLVDGAEHDAAARTDDGGFGVFAVSLPPRPGEANRLTFFEQNLVSRRQLILAALQRGYQAEVYCVQRRDISGSPLEVMEFTLLMGIPVSAAAAAHAGIDALPPLDSGTSCGSQRGCWWRGGGGAFPSSMTARSAAVQDEAWVRVCGRSTGGVVGAHQKSFVDFLRTAKDQGIVDADGRLTTPAPFVARAVEAYPPLQVTAASSGNRQNAFPTSLPTYAMTLTPNIVFLGHELCLCRHCTWPPSLLQHIFSERANVLNTYDEYLWKSRLEPQMLLYEELREAGVPAAKFMSEAAERRSGEYAQDADDVDGSSTLRSASWSRTRGDGAVGYAMVPESAGGSSGDSRNWTRQPPPPATGMTTMLAIAEVRFRVPVRRVEGVVVDGIAGTGAALPQGSSSSSVDAFTNSQIKMCDMPTARRTNDGTEVQKVEREFVIRYRGKYAEQVVSMVALRLLGVYVVHGIDMDELEQKLLRCRRVSSLQDTE